MVMYAVATLHLIIQILEPIITQKWSADDENAAGLDNTMKRFFDKFQDIGPV